MTDEERWYGERIAAQDQEDTRRADAETERLDRYFTDRPALRLESINRINRLYALREGWLTAEEYAKGSR